MNKKYDENGFDENGIHRDTGTKWDPEGWNAIGLHRDVSSNRDVSKKESE